MDREDLLAIVARAGITAEEVIDHPEHGVLISASAVRKLAAIAPNQEAAKEVIDMIAQEYRARLHVVDPAGQA